MYLSYEKVCHKGAAKQEKACVESMNMASSRQRYICRAFSFTGQRRLEKKIDRVDRISTVLLRVVDVRSLEILKVS